MQILPGTEEVVTWPSVPGSDTRGVPVYGGFEDGGRAVYKIDPRHESEAASRGWSVLRRDRHYTFVARPGPLEVVVLCISDP